MYFAIQIGKSLFDKEGAKLVDGIFKKAAAKGVKIHLPVDFVTGDKLSKDAVVGAADTQTGIPADVMVIFFFKILFPNFSPYIIWLW